MNYIYNLQYLLVPTQIHALLALNFQKEYYLNNVPSKQFIAVKIK